MHTPSARCPLVQHRRAKNVATVAVTTLLTTLLLELLCGAVLPPKLVGKMPQYVHSYHPYVGTILTPGYHSPDVAVEDKDQHWVETTINDLGVRSVREMQSKKEGYRVLVLGDSITFGYGVRDEESYPAYLDQLIRQVEPRADVLNSGISGSSNIRQARFYRAIGAGLEPDHVILQVYLGNDLWQNWREKDGPVSCTHYGIAQPFATGKSEAFRLGYDETSIYVPVSSVQRFDESLHYRSLVYRVVTDGLLSIPLFARTMSAVDLVRVRTYAPTYNLVDQPASDIEKARFTCEVIQELANEVRSNGSSFEVMIVPLYAGEPDFIGDALVRCLRDHGVDVVGREAIDRAHGYYTMARSAPQGHFTPAGNQVIASTLFRELAGRRSWSTEDVDAALIGELDHRVPATTPTSLLVDGEANDRRLQALEGRPRVPASVLSSRRGPPTPRPSSASERAPLLADGETVRYPQKWSIGHLEFRFALPEPTSLEAVVLHATQSSTMSPSLMRVFDETTGRLLSVSSRRFGKPGEVLASRRLGRVERLRVELVRAVGTHGFALRGFELVRSE